MLDVGGGAGIVRQFLPPDTKFVSVDPYVDYEQGIGPAKRQAYSCLRQPLNFIAACAEFLPFQAESFDWVHMRFCSIMSRAPILRLSRPRGC